MFKFSLLVGGFFFFKRSANTRVLVFRYTLPISMKAYERMAFVLEIDLTLRLRETMPLDLEIDWSIVYHQ